MRRAIARARLRARLKHWRHAKKKARLVGLRKLQGVRQMARLKQPRSLSFTLLKYENYVILRQSHVYLFVISLYQW